MKSLKRIIWGVVLMAVAVLLALNAFGIISFNLFFDGWWTLFIIIPSFVGLVEKGNKIDSLIGIGIGVFLLLCAQDILEFEVIWKLIVPAIIAVIGIKLIASSFNKGKTDKIVKEVKDEGRELHQGTAIFCGTNLNYDDVVFDGAELTACFGGIKCDLRKAIIDRDCVIKVCAAFGGIDILVPENVNIKSNTVSVFGGVDNKIANKQGAPTIYIDGLAIFGGVDVK
ncbi:MAG: LiaF transmembrane domain-containing protein [Eubacteriales bacterium]